MTHLLAQGIPWQIFEQSHGAQIVIGAILLMWQVAVTGVIWKQNASIARLNATVFNHYSKLPDRVKRIEKELGIAEPEPSAEDVEF